MNSDGKKVTCCNKCIKYGTQWYFKMSSAAEQEFSQSEIKIIFSLASTYITNIV